MTLLVISPDYASHLLPLATLATAWRDAGERVVVATGPATAPVVADFGYERVDLRLGRGSNPGIIRAEEQVRDEDASLRGFFEATRLGMVETLQYQADERRTDLLWQPVVKAEETLRIVDEIRPDHILVDHLAYGARLGLEAGAVPYADVVLGHPTALPVGSEVYGSPEVWPAAFTPDAARLAALRKRCQEVADGFTEEWNRALRVLAPGASPVRDAFAAHGPTVFLNYPAELQPVDRTRLLPEHHRFLGSAVRSERVDPDVDAWLSRQDDRPIVYVSFGSFLSARADVLARVADALGSLGLRVALTTGSSDPAALGDIPPSWLVRATLPQVTLLRRAHLAVTHGGNNSLTEAMTFGVPLLVLPFSTDQFAGASAVETSGLGVVLDPNTATVEELALEVGGLLDRGPAAPAIDLARRLTADPGPARARTALT